MANATDIRQGTIIRIVDDDDDIRDALGFMLECKGWQVREPMPRLGISPRRIRRAFRAVCFWTSECPT